MLWFERQHLIIIGELKERPIMLSPGRRELAADTRSASTLSQSKACSRAEENQFGRIFLVVAFYINICSAGAMTSLFCVLPRMCSPGQEFSPWLPGRLCPTCMSSTPITKEHIQHNRKSNRGQTKYNESHVQQACLQYLWLAQITKAKPLCKLCLKNGHSWNEVVI